MITKVYELTRLVSAYFTTKYMGIVVELPFNTGRGSSYENRSQFVTSDKFVQDAIENDPRFNKDFCLVSESDDGNDDVYAKKATETSSEKTEQKAKKNTTKKNVVADVTSINDAYDFFADRGVVLNTIEELRDAIKKESIEFPNLKL